MRVYGSPESRLARKSDRRVWFLAVLLFCLTGLIFWFTQKEKSFPAPARVYNFISPVANSAAKTSRPPWNVFGTLLSILRPSLREVILKEVKGARGTFGVVVKDLQTEKTIGIEENEKFYMASLYKVMVMYQAFKEADSGSLKFSDPIGNSTWGMVIESMITVSDNLAGESLGDRLGWEKIEREMRTIGLTQTSLADDLISTPSDMAALFTRIGRGQAVSEDSSRQMIEILLRQRLNSRLPKLLPEKVLVAHKTGEFGQFRHDAGIVFLPNARSYVIVVMSKDGGMDAESSAVVARISKVVYEYFATRL